MGKLRKILLLSDPYPNMFYEIFCYVKAILGFLSLVLGIFLILSSLIKQEPVFLGFAPVLGPIGQRLLAWEEKVFGQNFVILSTSLGLVFSLIGLWIFWQIKLVRKLIKLLFKA